MLLIAIHHAMTPRVQRHYQERHCNLGQFVTLNAMAKFGAGGQNHDYTIKIHVTRNPKLQKATQNTYEKSAESLAEPATCASSHAQCLRIGQIVHGSAT